MRGFRSPSRSMMRFILARLHPICIPVETCEGAELDEIVNLLNKGTHFDGVLAALKALLDKHIEVCEKEYCTGPHNKGWGEDEEPIRSALASIATAEARNENKTV